MNETIELYIRPLTLGDVSERYVGWLNDPEVTKYLHTKHIALPKLTEYVKTHTSRDDSRLLGIFVKGPDLFIGTFKFEPIDWITKKAQFAMMIGDRNYWGKGLGTKTTRIAAEYAFDTLGLDELSLGVIDQNVAAIKAYHHVGFRDISRDRIVTWDDGTEFCAVDMVLDRESFKRNNAVALS